jgi:hypothetical protein
MRWASLLFCCLFLAFTFAGAGAPLLASDLKSSREADDRGFSSKAEEVAEFCYEQRVICRKICRLRDRFEDRFDGCPQSCESRELRCNSTACFRWTDPDFIIAERFGAFRCAL